MARPWLVSCGLLLICCGCRPCESFRAPRLSEELGCSPTLSFFLEQREERRNGTWRKEEDKPSLFYFDPLGFATDENFARLREAELKHGRVAMLAVTEVLLVPILKRTAFVDDWLPAIRDCSDSVFYDNHLDGMDIVKVLVVCGFLEAFVFVQQDPQDLPGDYGTGFFGVRDYGLHEDKLVAELEHGRLAMLGLVGFLASDALTGGESWLEQWLRIFEAWVEQIPSGN